MDAGRADILFAQPADSPAQEHAYASQHFFLPCRYTDPFGSTTFVRYDAYDLLVLETEDPVHNKVTAGERTADGAITPGLDYRVLQPALLTDPNRNRSAAAFSALGLVVGNALMGKTSESLGNSLAGFTVDLPPLVSQAHLANPLTNPELILQQATTRLVYDLFAYFNTRGDPQPQPMVTYTLTRETHVSDLPPLTLPKFQHSFSYSDGFGREIQKKKQAETGPLVEGGLDVSPRWVGSGWTVYNNKGKPVRQYEPFFSASQAFEFGKAIGVSPVLFYDPPGRVVGTLRPDHSYEKTTFDPWKSATWDTNDTVLVTDPRLDPDLGDYFVRLPTGDFLPTWYSARAGGGLGPAEQSAAVKAAAHAATPAVACFDSLYRPFLRLADNGAQQFITRSEIDIEGQVLSVTDTLGRRVVDYAVRPGPPLAPGYDVAGRLLYQRHVDAGERRSLPDINAKPVYQWEARQGRLHTLFDGLRRPVQVLYLAQGALTEQLVERSVYGEPQGDAFNLRGKLYQQYDSAGLLTNTAYDFKGNAAWHHPPACLGLPLCPGLVRRRAPGGGHLHPFRHLRCPQPPLPDFGAGRQPGGACNLMKPACSNRSGLAAAGLARCRISSPISITTPKASASCVTYGSGVQTSISYDPLTFRMAHLVTLRGADRLQDLAYTYDPIGNLTLIQDAAQQSIYFNNAAAAPEMDYTYDPLYRLTGASGREHLSATPQTTWDDAGRIGLAHPNDWTAMRPYTEQYTYDPVGNLLSLVHSALGGNWTRLYTYDEPNLPPTTNLLTSTHVGAAADTYGYDPDGNLKQLNLAAFGWDYKDRLESADVAGGGTAYYRYDCRRAARAQGDRPPERDHSKGAHLPGRLRAVPRVQRSRRGGPGAFQPARHGRHAPPGPDRNPHPGRRRPAGPDPALPARQPPGFGQPGARPGRGDHLLRGVLSLRQHFLPGRAQPDRDRPEALPLHRHGARRRDRLQLPLGPLLSALAGALGQL